MGYLFEGCDVSLCTVYYGIYMQMYMRICYIGVTQCFLMRDVVVPNRCIYKEHLALIDLQILFKLI